MNGYKHSAETRNKISIANAGRKYSDERKQKMSEKAKGKHFSPSTEFKKGQNMGSKNHRWKNGEYKTSSGYIMVLQPSHPFRNYHGYVRKHRLVMEQHLGRYLSPIEVVHHKNGNTVDNCIENLQLFANHSDHSKLLRKLKP